MISERTRQSVLAFSEERDWAQFHSAENLAKSITIEAAELLECFQWSADADSDRAAEELADVLTYCILMGDRLGLDLDEIIARKLEDSRAKYPIAKSKGRSAKYDAL